MTIKRGFTLIELLIVIAIIGILAGVLITSLSGQRVKAYNANALTTLESVKPIAFGCVLDNKELTTYTTTDGGGAICAGITDNWPSLETTKTKWKYESLASVPADATFSYVATSGVAGTAPTITCTQAGCVKSGTGW